MRKSTIAILGAGSWGTAMALHASKKAKKVLLWGHNPAHMTQMAAEKRNSFYLPEFQFPDNLIPVADLNTCLTEAEHLIIAVPSHAFTELLLKLPPSLPHVAWLTKGLDPETHQILSELVSRHFGRTLPMAVISGPSFAKEVAANYPTAVTLAANDPGYQQQIHQLFHHQNLRVYLSEDLYGVQLCGAVKNVLAIACGISAGLGFGANSQAALITRGLAEMTRLGLKLGAQPETFSGLAGVGDLVLTCTDNQSRNRRFGLFLGQGFQFEQAQDKIGQVVEGKYNAAQVQALARQHKVEMPICEQVYLVLTGKISAKAAVDNLMGRPPKEE